MPTLKTAAPARPSAFPYDYQRMDATVAGYVAQWRLMRFDAVVAIARGGLAPALMCSTALSLPLFAVSYSRADRRVSWFTADTPMRGSKILLVEDVAGRGTTLSDSVDFLRTEGYDVSIFTLAYDAQSRLIPDFGLKVPAGFRAWFPWERESITPAFDACGNRPDRPEYDYASWAIDLDGVLLKDLPEQQYAQALEDTLAQRDLLSPNPTLPSLDLSQMTIITGRPEQDRHRTQTWLNQHGFHGPLIMRNVAVHTAAQTAMHKAEAILAGCHTHFLESDVGQAVEIASRTKIARVFWWDGDRAMMVYANTIDALHMT